jgi:radical SAM-linked protein
VSDAVRWRADLTYRKTGRLRFLGHLDLARGIERALRRARLPVTYTEGFNQRMRLSFGPPLPAGAEGLAEPASALLAERIASADVARLLGDQLPDDLGLVEAQVVPAATPAPLKAIRWASWRILLAEDAAVSRADLAAVTCRALSAPRLPVEREDGREPLDVRPRIRHLEVAPEGAGPELLAVLSAAGDSYLSPERLLVALAALAPDLPDLRWSRLVRTGFMSA